MTLDPKAVVLRDAVFEHRIFAADALRLPHVGAKDIGEHRSTWDFSQAEIDEELDRMHALGWLVRNNIGFWCATDIGKVAREKRFQETGRRQPALTDARSNVDDLVLALMHSEAADYPELMPGTLRLPERVLPIYLAHIESAELEPAIAALTAAGQIMRGPDFDNPGEMALFSTREDDIAYARTVAPRLGLTPSATILSRVGGDGLPFDELGLESLAAENLCFRWEEAQRCMQASAWLASSVLYGSMLELVLVDWLSRDKENAMSAKGAPKDAKTGTVLPLEKWSAEKLVEVSAGLGLIGNGVEKFAQGLRGTRNLIHPMKQIRERIELDTHTAQIAQMTVRAVIEALARTTRGGATA